MIAINLLPLHLRPIKRTPIPYILSGLLLVLAVLASLSVWLSTQSEIARRQNELTKNKEAFEELRPIVDESNRLVSQKKLLKAKTDAIQEIVKDRIIWSRQLWNLARLAPDNFWYDGISVDTVQKKQTKMVPQQDPQTKQMKMVPKEEMVPAPVLKVSGNVVADAQGANDVSPFLLITEKDPEFAGLFRLDDQEVKNDEIDGTPVKHFTLTFLILSGGGK